MINKRVIIARAKATPEGRTSEPAYSTITISPAVTQPTKAHRLTIFLKYSAGTSASFQKGRRVKNMNAASIRNIYLNVRNGYHPVKNILSRPPVGKYASR